MRTRTMFWWHAAVVRAAEDLAFRALIPKEGRALEAPPDMDAYIEHGPGVYVRLCAGGDLDPWRHTASFHIGKLARMLWQSPRKALHLIAWVWRLLRVCDGYIFPMKVSVVRQ